MCQDCNSSILQFSVHNCLYLLSKGVFKNSLHNVCRKTRNLLFMKKSRDINFLKKQIDFTKFHPEELVHMYSVSNLEMTIFREIILLVRVNFRSTFLSSCLTPHFLTLMGGNTCPLLPPIRVTKCGINHGLRKVRLKFFPISQKIVVSRLETL